MARFRTHRYALIADIEKMYRQILVSPRDSNLQRIVWRDAPHKELKHYALRTVTYGTASASFLATRCLKQISQENSIQHPIACSVIANDFYVDDLITGSDSSHVLARLNSDISGLLSRYGFTLHKWSSNDRNIISSHTNSSLDFNKDQTVRTLGIQWDVQADNFIYNFQRDLKIDVFNKRRVLSVIAGIYDPLGLIGPITFWCKHFMQTLWSSGTNWDDPLSDSLSIQWAELYAQLISDTHFKIPRAIKDSCNFPIISFQLHGFADASVKGYACCIYVRTVYSDRSISSHLLCSKSRVAPLKQISLPRLELCACLLLAQLVYKVVNAVTYNFSELYFYSDSTIALHWIHQQSSRWKVFVANRVAEIQQLTAKGTWYHVASHDNPADILSRGCLPRSLHHHPQWWHGPYWLSKEPSSWPTSPFESNSCLLYTSRCV